MIGFDRYIRNNIIRPPLISVRPEKSMKICVVIPCYAEPGLFCTLNSLAACTPAKSSTEVIVVLNSPENSSVEALATNRKTLSEFLTWRNQNSINGIKFHIVHIPNIEEKYAGAGRARKIGMDEAVRRFSSLNDENGIIVSLDADCLVRNNYLTEIENHFQNNPEHNFCTISFAHQTRHHDINERLKEGIILYELYMRYYKHALKYCGFPHAIYSLGSCFAVKASSYVKQGGMNSRKAGEDFYFLQKMTTLTGHYGHLSTTTVFPASRISERVPFGTGPALKKWMDGNSEMDSTYQFRAFEELKPFLENVKEYYRWNKSEMKNFTENFHPSLRDFIKQSKATENILRIRDNCSGPDIFKRRFFHQINAFWVLKYLNYSHIKYFKKGKLKKESINLLQKINYDVKDNDNLTNLLYIFRQMDNTIDI